MIPTIWFALGCGLILIPLIIYWNRIRCSKCGGRMRLYAQYIHANLAKNEWFYHCELCGHQERKRG